MDSSKRSKLFAAYSGLVVGLAVYSLIFFLRHKVYLIGSDTFYYLSIADSITRFGTVMDRTVTPARAVITPQNGVVLVHILLSGLGLGGEGRLVAMTIINWLLHLSAVYPLYRMSERLGLESGAPRAALLGVYLGAWHIYRMQLLAMNGGIFNPLSLWLTYLVMVALEEGQPLASALAIALSVVLVHFRLNTVLILGAALGAAVLTRRTWAVWAAGCGLAICSVLLPYCFTDAAGIVNTFEVRAVGGLGPRLPLAIVRLVSEVIPELLVTNAGLRANVMYGVFGLAVLLALICGLRERKPGLVFVCVSCVAGLGWTAGLLWQSYRYLVYVFPLLYLLLLLPRGTRSIGYLFVAVVLVSSFINLGMVGFPREPESRFWLHLHEQGIKLDEDALLVSEKPRHPYFFLDARAFQRELALELLRTRGDAFILGSEKWRAKHVYRLESWLGTECAQASLTPRYRDEEGHALVRLTCFPRKGTYDGIIQ
jgi:hypothetical protein